MELQYGDGESLELGAFRLRADSRKTQAEIELGAIKKRAPSRTAASSSADEASTPNNLTRSQDSANTLTGLQDVETVSLSPSSFSLILLSASRRAPLLLPLLLGIPVTAAQVTVPLVISSRYPEYLWNHGRWLEPVGDAPGLLSMKIFGLVLLLVQVADEFQEIGDAFRVLCQSSINKATTSRSYRITCWVYALLQYSGAILVMVVGSHLVLSREKPIEALWITYYVFMTLNFDNLIVRFSILLWTQRRPQNFEIQLIPPGTEADFDWRDRFERRHKMLVIYLPLVFGVLLNCLCIGFNVNPITLLRYGFVTNGRPNQMMKAFPLPGDCCGVSAVWVDSNVTFETKVMISVPFLSFDAPEDNGPPPVVSWVVWPSRKDAPSSLQVIEGRGGDGSPGLLSGKVDARPVEILHWLLEHGYELSLAQEIMEALLSRKSRIELYNSMFPYEASWTIPHFPWNQEARVYATARNQITGALSPLAVESQVLLGSRCPEYCERCNNHGKCRKCADGYVSDAGDAEEIHRCVPCAAKCKKCSYPGSCSKSGCMDGFGHVQGRCLPCSSRSCLSCDAAEDDGPKHIIHGHPDHADHGHGEPEIDMLPCITCKDGHGLEEDGMCKLCNAEHCAVCSRATICSECEPGYTPDVDPDQPNNGTTLCAKCAKYCTKCTTAGAGQCDDNSCEAGYTTTRTHNCEPCSANCEKCDNNGAGHCDKNGCRDGYGLQGTGGSEAWWMRTQTRCTRCAVKHCKKCDLSEGCEMCEDDYGLTPDFKCSSCGLGCLGCDEAGQCRMCLNGYILVEGKCKSCADKCLQCDNAGAASCDNVSCAPGWTTVSSGRPLQYVCRPCSDRDCQRCDEHGPGTCDVNIISARGEGLRLSS